VATPKFSLGVRAAVTAVSPDTAAQRVIHEFENGPLGAEGAFVIGAGTGGDDDHRVPPALG
jgi:hypothetical protein